MPQRNTLSQASMFLIAGLVLFAYPATATIAADDYLGALEAEAGDVSSTNEVRQVSKKKRVLTSKSIEAGLDFSAFEATLGSNYSGSHFLYSKLSRADRKGVYRFYQNDNRISLMREEIVRRLSSSE